MSFKNNDAAKKILTYAGFDEVLEKSDLISIHMPYFKEQNDEVINEQAIKKMRQGAFLVNSSRAELVSLLAVIKAIKENHLGVTMQQMFFLMNLQLLIIILKEIFQII